MTEVPNPYSFKGWSFKELVRRNKDNVKAAVVLLAGYNYLVGFSWQSLLVGLGAILGKMIVDTLDYWLSE
jgi:hypothetical protein